MPKSLPLLHSCLCLYLLTNLAFAQVEKSALRLNLAKCEELALENSAKIKDAQFGIRLLEHKRTQARAARFLPKFEVRNVWGFIPKSDGVLDSTGGFVIQKDVDTSIPKDLSYFTELQLDLVQPIFTFGKLKGIGDAAYFGVELKEAELKKKENDTLFDVRKLYWGFVFAQELLNVAVAVQTEISKAESKIENKLDEGAEDVTQTDLFKLQIFKYEVNKRHRQVVDEIALAESALRIMLNIEDSTEIEIDDQFLEPVDFMPHNLDTYLQIASSDRPEVAQLRAGTSARRALISVSKSDFYPQFFFAGQIKYNYAPDRFDPKGQYIHNLTNYFQPGFVFGLNMDLNFWQTRSKVRIAQVEYARLAEQETFLQSGLKLDVQKAYIELNQAALNLKESRKALQASENWLRSESMTFDLGVGEVKDFIDAYKANSSMKAEHLENMFKYNTAVARLSKAIGRDLYPR